MSTTVAAIEAAMNDLVMTAISTIASYLAGGEAAPADGQVDAALDVLELVYRYGVGEEPCCSIAEDLFAQLPLPPLPQ